MTADTGWLVCDIPGRGSASTDTLGATMGQLVYGAALTIQIDDWALHHLEMVMLTKLRRDESFRFSWGGEPGVSGDQNRPGRPGAVWMSRSSTLYFSYDAPLTRPLNGRWLGVLMTAANGSHGLRLVPEPSETSPTGGTSQA